VNEIDEIRQQMALIRRELHEDVSGVVSGVSEAMDWRALLQRHPWASVGAAALAGYLVVPRRASENGQAMPLLAESEPVSARRRGRSLAGRALGLLWPIAEQALQSYALVWINGRIKQYLDGNGVGPHPYPLGPEQEPAERPREASFRGFTIGER
jgi:hypothetical protein